MSAPARPGPGARGRPSRDAVTRGALAVLGVAVLAGCGGTAGVGPATTRTDAAPLTEPVSAVRIDLPAGDVAVRVVPEATPTVRRTVTSAGIGPPGATHRVEAGELRLAGCTEQTCTVDYEVELPAAAGVGGRVASGDVRLEGSGAVDLVTGPGDVRVSAPGGPVTVAGGSGTVALDLPRPVDATVTTTSGDVEVAAAGPYRVTVAAGGDAEVAVPDDPAAAARLDLRTGSGDVRVAPAP